MAVTEDTVTVPAGKLLDTTQVTQTDGTPALREVVTVGDPETLAAYMAVLNSTPGSSVYGGVVRLVPDAAGLLDHALEAARGNVTSIATINKFGRNADVDTALEDVWTGGGTWVAPTQARTHQIKSDSANDDGDPVGTGARTIRIFGLTDWDTAEVNEDITMNGTTDVPTVNQYVIIHRMRVLTAGSAGPNAGNITATADTDGTVTARIEAGDGQTQMAIYGIPSTQNLYIRQLYGTVEKQTDVAADLELRVNPEPGDNASTYLMKTYLGMSRSGGNILREYNPPFVIEGPAIIKLRAESSAVNGDIGAGFDAFLVTE